MKVAVGPTALVTAPPLALRQRITDYVTLTKPRIAVMVLITVAAGYLMAAQREAKFVTLLHTLIGTAFVAAGASAWNNWIERGSDGKMKRTANRPLPAGRLNPLEVVVFGTALAVTGVNYLLNALPSPAAAIVAGLSFLTYVAIYTPLKQVTVYNTHLGALPGALPPVIGWCAATGSLSLDVLPIFLVLLFWQLPHFMAIAWMYRDEYGRANHKMIPVLDETGRRTSRTMIFWCVVLVAASLLPLVLHPVDGYYAAGALLLGVYFLQSTLKFRRQRTREQAKAVLKASILYLPGMMGLLLLHAFVTG